MVKRVITRRYVLLLELLIAMALMSVLMIALMGYYGQIATLNREADQIRDETFQWRYLQNRLAYVLPRATAPSYRATPKEKKNDFYFYTSDAENAYMQSPSLVFTFDNGFVSDPMFSGPVLARLFLNKGALRLAIWPLPRCARQGNPPMLQEVLLENVESLSFDFYNPQPATGAPKPEKEIFPKPTEEPAINLWTLFWSIGFRQLPAIVTVKVKRKNDAEVKTFSFVLPNCTKPIVVR